MFVISSAKVVTLGELGILGVMQLIYEITTPLTCVKRDRKPIHSHGVIGFGIPSRLHSHGVIGFGIPSRLHSHGVIGFGIPSDFTVMES